MAITCYSKIGFMLIGIIDDDNVALSKRIRFESGPSFVDAGDLLAGLWADTVMRWNDLYSLSEVLSDFRCYERGG